MDCLLERLVVLLSTSSNWIHMWCVFLPSQKHPISLGGSSRVSKKKRVGNLTRIRLFLPFRLIHTNFCNSRTNDCISTLIWFQKNWIIRHTSLYVWAWCVTWVNCLHLFLVTEVWAWVTGTAFQASSGRQPSTLLTPLQLALDRVSQSMPSWGWNYPISRRGNF